MRHPRLKPAGQDTFYHVYNRVAGNRYDLPFGDVVTIHLAPVGTGLGLVGDSFPLCRVD